MLMIHIMFTYQNMQVIPENMLSDVFIVSDEGHCCLKKLKNFGTS